MRSVQISIHETAKPVGAAAASHGDATSELKMTEAIRELVGTEGIDAEISDKIVRAIVRFQVRDLTLLEVDGNERSLTHRLGMYLQDEFAEWDVDCEYNRNGVRPKRLKSIRERSDDNGGVTVYPDIIIHRRGVGKNLLVVEVKKGNSSSLKDCDKLAAYKCELGYTFGVFLRFGNKGLTECRWI